MRGSICRAALAAGFVCLAAVVSQAQQTTSKSIEMKTFEVIAVQGSQLVVRLPEGTRELTVPDDFRFTVNGQPMSVQQLKPGMKGTATITTQTTVTPVTVTEVKNGTVFSRSGASIVVQTPEGFRSFNQGELDKRGVKILRDGKPIALDGLNRGDKLTATIVTTHPPKVMTQKEVQATVAAPAAAPPAAAARPAAPSDAPPAAPPSATGTTARSAGTPKTLPKTASAWPLLGLLSTLSLAAGIGLTIRRRVVS
jgi:hypothetical protein